MGAMLKRLSTVSLEFKGFGSVFNRLFGVVLGVFWYYSAKEMLKFVL